MSISVVISVYEFENSDNLRRSLISVWDDQELKPDEIVLIEDGPIGNDLSRIINQWRSRLGPQFKLIVNKNNIGLTKSLNKGIQAASGTYIARMDSDDISTPLRFKLQKEYLDSNKDISVVGGSIMEFDSIHENLGLRKFPIDSEAVRNYIHKASPLAHPTVMIRKKIFDDGLSYNETYRTSQDIALWFDVLKAGYKIGNLEEVTLKFRREGDVYKRRSRAKAFDELKIYLKGIYSLYGILTWKYIYPIARFCFRMMPVSVIRYIYGTKLRAKILQ